MRYTFPVSILYKSISGRYRPVRVADGPITARYRFIKNASWVITCNGRRFLRLRSSCSIFSSGGPRSLEQNHFS